MCSRVSIGLVLGLGLAALASAWPAAGQVPPLPAPSRAAVFGTDAPAPASATAPESQKPLPRVESAAKLQAAASPPVEQPAATPRPDAADAPESTTATYGTWTLHCVRLPANAGSGESDGGKAGNERCELEQPIISEGRAIAQIVIGADPDTGEMRIVAQLPDGAWLPAQPFLSFGDHNDPVTLTYKRCLKGTCLADAAFTMKLDLAMKAAKGPGLISFQMVPGKDIALPVSIDGFAAADVALRQR